MSQHSSPPPRWPAWLAFIILLVAPPAALMSFLQANTHNPWVTAGLIVAYEFIVGLGAVISGFARKTWQQLEDSWAKSLAHRLDNRVRERFGGYEHRYREYFHYEHRDLDMKGISTRGTYTLDLEQVFVELRIDPTPAHQASADPLRVPPELRSGTHDIWDYLTLLDQHLVILGAPGSGKTTLLKHLGLSLVVRQQRPRHRNGKQLSWTLPVFLTLREQNSALKEHPEYSLAEAVEAQVQKWRQAFPLEWIERMLRQGQCLVLLDGLDEIADTEFRQKMVEWVDHQMVTYGKNRFMITSRPLGYQQNPLDRVAVLEVQPFTFEQVTQFLDAWYVANEIKRAVRDDPGVRMQARKGAEDLLQRLRNTPTLFALAVNPLLLTMIATVHLYYGTLPGARVTLYKAICEVFLRRRQHDPANPYDLRAEQRQVVLQTLAYTMMQWGQLELAHTEVCQIIRAPLQRVSTALTPDAFLQRLEIIGSGLLLERERGTYGFAHKTFLEYLAMVYMQEQHLEQELLTHLEESWWHETILLYCAQADATPIIRACLARPSLSLEVLTLAIECVEEARDVQAEVKERLYRFLEQGVEESDPVRRRVITEALLTRRLRQMRPFQGMVYADTSLVTCAEYQLFLDEQRAQGRIYTPDHWRDVMFPPDLAWQPMLGVRAADAKAFCHWLTARDREGWLYRLPRREEWLQESKFLEGDIPEQAGFWVEEEFIVFPLEVTSRPQYNQIVSLVTSARTRADALTDAFSFAFDLTLAQILALHTDALTRTLDLDLDFVFGLSYGLDFDLDLARARTRADALTDALTDARNFVYAFDFTHARVRVRGLTNALTDALTDARNLAQALDFAHARARAHGLTDDLTDDLTDARNLAQALDFARVLDRATALAHDLHTEHVDGARALAHDLALALAHALTHTFEIFLAVYLLLERMNGRFPVHEGILLMKERLQKEMIARGN